MRSTKKGGIGMAETVVEVEGLHLAYRNVQAVQGVTFCVEQGEILAVIGPNGSGKTSTVECVEGLRKPDSGRISVFGKDPFQHRGEVYEKMGVQLQETAYPSKIRVEELCRLFAAFYDRPADWEALLRQMDLENKRKRWVSKLSGGEKQRLSVLLSLMGRPKLMILDELTTGLDPEVRQSMWRSFEAIRDSGVSIILVSHYLDEVEALAGRILFLEDGKQQFLGSKQEFYSYAKERISEKNWDDSDSLEKLYLKLMPKQGGISMDAIG